ncbi:MAG: sulfatase-like hydrolase/transferase [Prolixibacteraceae bacterium]|jgi:N-sulfoglucosamine sulfohydrolase|nr:sulfatase-like hydrolase/transferase [Prolixibacteraceae bacterium]MBT6767301.1 sulfatase-like hydrolase/transferase [Prolixibacteraceae bacterium]MBT6997712.1 sulfatase-like hydrolase/transferase [Prolixibacteraceae bacterium]MBT7395333.1 sulfatase-like hydrolase/transferase [Prolixibacteraceae bacterium]
MNIKTILTLFVSIIFLWSCKNTAQTELEKPNILWITTEDISPQIGCYGFEFVNTPIIDQLAADGVMYTNAIASAPVCAPARSSIITGMHQSSIGSHHMRCKGWFPEEFKYYPQLLREAGYYCTNNSKEDYNVNYNSEEIWDESSNKAHWKNRPDKTQPFFAVFNFTGTHESGTNSKSKHETVCKDLPKEIMIKPGEAPLPPYFPDTPIVNELWARYCNNISALDRVAENLLNELKEEGVEDNTIVFFYSDHGAGIPIHKRWLYDSGLKVPFIVYCPEKYKHLMPHKQGNPSDELVSFIDLPPTALNLAGITVPENMQGRAFLGENLSPERDYVYASRDRMDERYDMQRAVRDKQYKYIRYYEFPKPFIQYMNTPEKGEIMQSIRSSFANGTLPEAGVKLMAQKKPVEELFDLEKDPQELNDLAGNPEYKDVLDKMRQAHKDWSVRVADAGLIPEPILREWETKYNKPIYKILRENEIPVDKIQEVALASDISTFVENLNHKNEAVRYWAATGIGNYATVGNKEIFDGLSPLINDEYPLVRIAAARAFCILNQESEGLKTLSAGLTDSNEWTRLNAALVLDEIDEKARPLIPDLQKVMNDENKYVVRVTNRALNQLLGTNNVVP